MLLRRPRNHRVCTVGSVRKLLESSRVRAIFFVTGISASGGGNGPWAADVPETTDDGNPCTIDTCVSGNPSHQNIAPGTQVSDGNYCNGIETCGGSGGVGNGQIVAGSPVNYDDGTTCTTDYCDPISGIHNVNNGTCSVPPGQPSGPPPNTASVLTSFAANTSVLYSGNASIDPTHVAVLRGRVLDLNTSGNPPGISVSILGHGSLDATNFGTVTTRSDGYFDIAVNGGTSYVVQFSQTVPSSPTAAYYLPAQRHADAHWHDYTVLDDVFLVSAAPGQPVTLGSNGATGWTTIVGPTTTSAQDPLSASRTPRILIPPSTTVATALDASGNLTSWTPPSSANLRITEFSVGGNKGMKAMPGDLPAQSGYTYAILA